MYGPVLRHFLVTATYSNDSTTSKISTKTGLTKTSTWSEHCNPCTRARQSVRISTRMKWASLAHRNASAIRHCQRFNHQSRGCKNLPSLFFGRTKEAPESGEYTIRSPSSKTPSIPLNTLLFRTRQIAHNREISPPKLPILSGAPLSHPSNQSMNGTWDHTTEKSNPSNQSLKHDRD